MRPGLEESIPDGPGVLVLASLVRTILYVGAAQGLRSALPAALASAGLRRRAHCVRFESTPDPVARATEILAAYRAAHDGSLPAEQPRTGAPLRVLGTARAETPPRAGAERVASPTPIFLRARTVA